MITANAANTARHDFLRQTDGVLKQNADHTEGYSCDISNSSDQQIEHKMALQAMAVAVLKQSHHVEGALELDIIRLSLQLVVPV